MDPPASPSHRDGDRDRPDDVQLDVMPSPAEEGSPEAKEEAEAPAAAAAASSSPPLASPPARIVQPQITRPGHFLFIRIRVTHPDRTMAASAHRKDFTSDVFASMDGGLTWCVRPEMVGTRKTHVCGQYHFRQYKDDPDDHFHPFLKPHPSLGGDGPPCYSPSRETPYDRVYALELTQDQRGAMIDWVRKCTPEQPGAGTGKPCAHLSNFLKTQSKDTPIEQIQAAAAKALAASLSGKAADGPAAARPVRSDLDAAPALPVDYSRLDASGRSELRCLLAGVPGSYSAPAREAYLSHLDAQQRDYRTRVSHLSSWLMSRGSDRVRWYHYSALQKAAYMVDVIAIDQLDSYRYVNVDPELTHAFFEALAAGEKVRAEYIRARIRAKINCMLKIWLGAAAGLFSVATSAMSATALYLMRTAY